MSCCGKKRASINKTVSPPPPTTRPVSNPVVWFQYTGANTFTIIGNATKISYHFSHSGAIRAVDRRDYMTLALVPTLQQTAEPKRHQLA
jgi:hypothetical protein